MRYRNPFCLIVVLAVLLAAAGAVAQEADKPDATAPPSKDASREPIRVMLVVSFDPAVLQVDSCGIANMLNLYHQLERYGYTVAFQILPWGQTEEQVIGMLELKPINLSTKSPPPRSASREELLAMVSSHLQKLLMKMAEARIEILSKQRALAKKRVEQLEASQRELHEQMVEFRRRLAQHKVLSDSIEASYGMLTPELVKSQIELAGLQARHKHVLREIEQIKKEARASVDDSHPELEYLRAAILVKEKQLERLVTLNKRRSGTISEADLDIARAELLAARAEIEARRRELGQKTADMLPELNRQLVDTSARIAEIEARLRAIHDMIREVESGPVPRLLADQDIIFEKLKPVTTALSEEREALSHFEHDCNSLQRPTVKILQP